MVEIRAVYEGDLTCRLIHEPSGQTLTTDAPKDHFGQGSAFSPTDLVAAALGSCLLTTMGIVAKRRQLDLGGTEARVVKEMRSDPVRRIGRLSVVITFRKRFSDEERLLLERAALSCPVHKSLHPEIEAPVEFVYQG